MSTLGPQPGSADVDDSFASGLVAHLERYRAERADPGPVFLTIRLADGAAIDLEGLRIDRLQNVPGCVMVRGTSVGSRGAVVVREDYLLTAHYDTEPEVGLGFIPRL